MIISAMTYIACWTLHIIIIFIAYYIYIYIFHILYREYWMNNEKFFISKKWKRRKKLFVNLEYNYYIYVKIKKNLSKNKPKKKLWNNVKTNILLLYHFYYNR